MPFIFQLTDDAKAQYSTLKADNTKKGKAAFAAVKKALNLLSQNPRHAGLNSHEWHSKKGVNDEKIWEVYAQNNTPGAWRVFWHYGPGQGKITVVLITPHP